jgi:predicted metal-dependent phosphotriesterase family hydrolase
MFDGLKKEGLSQADIDQMSKVNPAQVLGLP